MTINDELADWISPITDDLLLGRAPCGVEMDHLKEIGVTQVIDLRQKKEVWDGTASEWERIGMKYHHLPLLPTGPHEPESFETIVNLIEDEIEEGGLTYIHCTYGVSRSPTATAVYLMSVGRSLENAVDETSTKRPQSDIRGEDTERYLLAWANGPGRERPSRTTK